MAKPRYNLLTVAGAAGLAWNLVGLAMVFGDTFGSESARYTLSAAERALNDLTPNWVFLGSLVACFCGALGSIGLLLRRSWAVMILVVSLVGLVVQDVGIGIAIWRAGALPGPVTLVLQSLILIAALALLALAFSARDAHKLR